MAVITEIDREAGFQVRIRWYVQGTQRYPANENEYYSTFFNTLNPNTTFNLEDPRFVVANINDLEEDLQYVVRDICHTVTLVPQFVDNIYINPDYITFTNLDGAVNGGVSTITVDAFPIDDYGDVEIVVGNFIQLGPLQTDVYQVREINLGNTQLILGDPTISDTTADGALTPTTKPFPDGTVVSVSNTVDGRYPDVNPETALARVLDNTGQTVSGPIQVTTPLFFDEEETVRRFYYDSALQTPFNGALGSGETVEQEVPDPRRVGAEILAGWWSAGDLDNQAADEALLIDDQGFLIARRDRDHAFIQPLYYSETEPGACVSMTEAFYLSNHADFKDSGFTSIRNDDAALTQPAEGFYSWAEPSIIIAGDTIYVYFGDLQYYPGETDNEGLTVGPITFSGIIDETDVEFTVSSGTVNALGTGELDRWELDISTANPVGFDLTTGPRGFVDSVAIEESTSYTFHRYVRYWNGDSFDTGRVHPTLNIDQCPVQITDFVDVVTYATQQDGACNFQGTSQRLFYYTHLQNDKDFKPGNVSAIFTDSFGPNSDPPSGLTAGTFIRFNEVVYRWDGGSLQLDNDPCISRYCPDLGAVNGTTAPPGGIPDSSICVYPRDYCGDPAADNYTPNPASYDTLNNGICIFPQPDTYSVFANQVSSGLSPSEGWNVTVNGTGGYLTTDSYSVTVTIEPASGYESSDSPVASFPDGNNTGGPLGNGQSVTVNYTLPSATATLIPPDMLEPESQTFSYGASDDQACNVFNTEFRTIFWENGVSLDVGVSVYSNSELTSPADTGWYTVGTGPTGSTMYVSGGQVSQGFMSCPSEPPQASFTIPTLSAISPDGNPTEIADQVTFSVSLTDPDNLVDRIEWSVGGGYGLAVASDQLSARVFAGGFGLSALSASLYYNHPISGSTPSTVSTVFVTHSGGGF